MHHSLAGKEQNQAFVTPIKWKKKISRQFQQVQIETSKLLVDAVQYPTIDDDFTIEESITKDGLLILKLSFQFCLFMLFEVGTITISSIFLGHLYASQILSFTTIAYAFTLITTFGVSSGFASSLKTLITQKSDTFYAEKSKILYTQRAFIICILSQMPISMLLFYFIDILCINNNYYFADICRNNNEIQIITDCIRCLLPFPYFMIALIILQTIAKSLKYNSYLLSIVAVIFFISIPFNYVFIQVMGLSHIGCALTLDLMSFLTVILTAILLIIKGYSSMFQPLAFDVIFTQTGLYEYFSIAMDNIVQSFASFITIQLVMLILSAFAIAQKQSTIAVSATLIMIEINLFGNIVHFSIANGIKQRIKNYVDNCCIYYAKRCIKIQIFVEIGLTFVLCVFIIGFRQELPLIFTNDSEIIAIVSQFLIIAVINQIFLGIYHNVSAICEALEYQKLSTNIVAITQYLIALPLQLYLLFGSNTYRKDTQMCVYIIWLGFTFGYILADILIIAILIYYVDWSKPLSYTASNQNQNIQNNISSDKTVMIESTNTISPLSSSYNYGTIKGDNVTQSVSM